MSGLPYECGECPESRPALYYCAEVGGEVRCLGPLASNHATAVVTAGGGGGVGSRGR